MSVTTPAPIMDTYKRWPVTFTGGEGARLFDEQGRSYIDLLAGIAVAVLGQGHPAVIEAVDAQIRSLIHVSNLYSTQPAQALAARLAELSGGYRSFFCNSGAESIECALKLARRWGGKNKAGAAGIVCAQGAFHGRTFGALAATGQPAKQAPFRPLPPGFTHIAYGDVEALAHAITPDVTAVLLEPIQGEAGVVVPPEGYLAAVRALCDETSTLLILDEVQTGIGRTGAWFAFQHEGIRPDIFCLAKGLAGGLPIGACLATPEVAAAFEPGDHASTFGGNPVTTAAALAVLDVLERENLVERTATLGPRVAAMLSDAFGGAEVRGRGLMLGVVLGVPLARAVTAAALERGVLVNDAAPDVVRVTPPLVITEAELTEAVAILKEVWRDVGPA